RLSLIDGRILPFEVIDCKVLLPIFLRLRPNLIESGISESFPKQQWELAGGSRGLDDGAGFEEAVAALLVDLEPGEEAVADESEGFVDGFGVGIGERDGSSGSFVVTSGGAETVDDDPEDFAGVAS